MTLYSQECELIKDPDPMDSWMCTGLNNPVRELTSNISQQCRCPKLTSSNLPFRLFGCSNSAVIRMRTKLTLRVIRMPNAVHRIDHIWSDKPRVIIVYNCKTITGTVLQCHTTSSVLFIHLLCHRIVRAKVTDWVAGVIRLVCSAGSWCISPLSVLFSIFKSKSNQVMDQTNWYIVNFDVKLSLVL